MIGTPITNVTLVANTITEIEYPEAPQTADVINYGPGTVYASWLKAPAIAQADCLRLDASQSYEIKTNAPWQVLRMISAGTPAVQVVIR